MVEVICHYPGGPGVRLAGPWAARDRSTREVIRARVEAGELICLPCGSIAEPISRHEDDAAAHRERDRLVERSVRDGRVGESDYRVILTSSLAAQS